MRDWFDSGDAGSLRESIRKIICDRSRKKAIDLKQDELNEIECEETDVKNVSRGEIASSSRDAEAIAVVDEADYSEMPVLERQDIGPSDQPNNRDEAIGPDVQATVEDNRPASEMHTPNGQPTADKFSSSDVCDQDESEQMDTTGVVPETAPL